MKIFRWDPFKDIMMVEDFFNPAAAGRENEKTCTWSPAVDVYETEKDVVLTAELPGLRQEDVELTIYEDVLTLKGHRRFEKDVRQENYHRVERNYGHFCRRFSMPCEVDGDSITASFKDGVLRVSLPKRKTAKKVHVKVKA